MTVRLHFSIGPVQVFVSQSRRTRDLWVSSYLLSYLAGRAMTAVAGRGGTLVLPRVAPEEFARYGDDKRARDSRPDRATLPNRFVAEFADQQSAIEAARAADHAVRSTWKHMANAVWKRYVAPMQSKGRDTDEIWQRQVEHFWDATWIVSQASPSQGSGVADEGFALLASRKHWRPARLASEPGDHCTMMGDYQELSGYIRNRKRSEQDAFWDAMRARVSNLDLREDERLCAIALIKRLFPLVSSEAIGKDLGTDAMRWPSTLYMAAYPWLEEMCAAHPARAAEYARLAYTSRRALGEKQAGKRLHLAHADAKKFPLLDGNFFFDNALANPRATPLEEDQGDPSDLRARLIEQLRELYELKSEHDQPLGAPSPCFALLLMDGDNMGALLRAAGERDQMDRVTEALTGFARAVPDIVEQEYDGAAVYAGGDDVLALLPLDRALDAALALRAAYQDSFANAQLSAELREGATISAALLFAHYRLPLRGLLKAAHDLLDHVAKDQTGRDSVVISLRKSSGETARWSAPWKHLCGPAGRTPAKPAVLDTLIEHFEAGRLGNSVIYRLRNLLGQLTHKSDIAPDAWLQAPFAADHAEAADHDALGQDTRQFFAAEILTDREQQDMNRDTAEHIADALYQAAIRVSRERDGTLHRPGNELRFDAAMIAGFLHSKGKEDGR